MAGGITRDAARRADAVPPGGTALSLRPGMIDARIDRHGARLRRQIDRLYRDAPGLWGEVEAVLRARHADRAPDLRALDAHRAAHPDWFVAPDMIGYSTYVDRFGGDVAGVAAHVDHLEALGVRYLHLLALLKARAGDSDGGFAVADYLGIEPSLGTMADVAALTRRLRAARISLCVDFALNHTADDHPWALAAKAGDPGYRDFYIVLDDDAARERETALHEIFPQTAPGNFTPVPAMGGQVWTTFYPFQWDLNWANPRVFVAMLDTLLRLANHGFEAFRLDSIAFLWKEAGTDCRNRPQAHWIVRALRAALDIVAPAVLLKAEAIVPTRFVLPYFGVDDGDGFEPECHLVYNNSLMVAGWVALTEGSAALPAAILRESGGLPAAANWLTYARCHDDIGWGAVLRDLPGAEAEARLKAAAALLEGGGWGRGEPFQTDGAGLHGTNGMLASLAGLEAGDPDAFARIRLLNALAIAAGGLATQYMGDELGLLNDHGYRADPLRAHEGRWLHRPAMDWGAVDGAAARRILDDLAALRDARIASGGAGAPTLLESFGPAVLAIGCGTDRVYLNFGAACRVPQAGAWRDRLGGAAGEGAIPLAALDVAWIEGRDR